MHYPFLKKINKKKEKEKKKGNFYHQVPYQMPLASIKLEYNQLSVNLTNNFVNNLFKVMLLTKPWCWSQLDKKIPSALLKIYLFIHIDILIVVLKIKIQKKKKKKNVLTQIYYQQGIRPEEHIKRNTFSKEKKEKEKTSRWFSKK